MTLAPAAIAVISAFGIACPSVALAQGDERTEGSEETEVAAAGQGDQAEVHSLENWEYDDLYAGWRADDVLDAPVIGEEGEEIGDVENLLLNEQGQIVALVAEVGGFLEIGDTHIAVPWEEVELRDDESVRIPLTQENVEDYSLFDDAYFGSVDVGEIETVEDDVETGPDIWKATNLLDDYVVMPDGEGYGYINDLIFNDEGQLQGVVANATNDVFGEYGHYAYPWLGWGYPYGWDDDLDYYVLPYTREQIAGLTVFDFEAMDD